MSLISLSNAYLSFSDQPLLDHVQLHVELNERICLVGRNGAGKSTLLKVINGDIKLDDGQITFQKDLVVAYLQQDPPSTLLGTVYDFVVDGLKEQAELLKRYHNITQQIVQDPSSQNLDQLTAIQQQLDHYNIWQIDDRIRHVLQQVELDADTELAALSGGWLRKAVFAKALVANPDVLLLDEPTNHLDIQSIAWLEQFLQTFSGTIIFISHDRAFIRNMATRIIDLDRGKLASWPGNYDHYLIAKEEALRVEEQQNAEFDQRLAQEEAWIRQGIKARRTRNEGRVRALKALRNEYANRRQVMGKAKINVEETIRSGKIVFEIDDLSYHIGDKLLINHFSIQVLRGDKIALVGPNGCGKTTLLKLMLQQLQPTGGSVHIGTKLAVAYFDQHRAVLDLEKTVMDNVADGMQEVIINGQTRHVLGYLQEFLFPPKRAMTPVNALSGGERNRLLLAKLFLKQSNLLILDEPTNDLDIETLELLEERLSEYQGTILLVSHDRQFVDNVVSACWIFEGNGMITPYVGGYHDANQQLVMSTAKRQSTTSKKDSEELVSIKEKSSYEKKRSVKLSYNQLRELEQLPAKIEQLEALLAKLQAQIDESTFFSQPHSVTHAVLSQLNDTQQQLDAAFTRWEELETLK